MTRGRAGPGGTRSGDREEWLEVLLTSELKRAAAASGTITCIQCLIHTLLWNVKIDLNKKLNIL